jgi:hypothetical protein
MAGGIGAGEIGAGMEKEAGTGAGMGARAIKESLENRTHFGVRSLLPDVASRQRKLLLRFLAKAMKPVAGLDMDNADDWVDVSKNG